MVLYMYRKIRNCRCYNLCNNPDLPLGLTIVPQCLECTSVPNGKPGISDAIMQQMSNLKQPLAPCMLHISMPYSEPSEFALLASYLQLAASCACRSAYLEPACNVS